MPLDQGHRVMSKQAHEGIVMIERDSIWSHTRGSGEGDEKDDMRAIC
jgi:hypothetical protein